MLYAAERQTRIGSDHSVDENRAGFNLVNKPSLFVWIVCPGSRTQAERRRVGELNRFIDGADSKEGSRCPRSLESTELNGRFAG